MPPAASAAPPQDPRWLLRLLLLLLEKLLEWLLSSPVSAAAQVQAGVATGHCVGGVLPWAARSAASGVVAQVQGCEQVRGAGASLCEAQCRSVLRGYHSMCLCTGEQ